MNNSAREGVLRNQFLLSLFANGSRTILGFVFFWQVSQALGLKTLGEYLYVTAALGYFGTLIDYGFNLFVLNNAPRIEGSVRPLFIRVILSKLVMTLISTTILVGLYNVAFAEQGRMVAALFFLVIVLQSFSGLLIHFFKAMGRFDHELSSTLLASTLPVLAMFALSDDISLLNLACIVVVVRALVLVFQIAVFLRLTIGQGWIHLDEIVGRMLPKAMKDIRNNTKYALFSVLGSLYLSVDIVVMRFVLGPEEVSVYGTAMKIIMAGILFFEVLGSTFTPRLAKLHSIGAESFQREVNRFCVIMLVAALLFSLVIFIAGPTLIAWAFGPQFEAAGQVVRLLSVVLVLRVAEMTTGPLLTVHGLQAFRARAMVVVVPLHLGLNLVLQPQFGIWGAVGSLAFSFLLLFVLNTFYLLNKLNTVNTSSTGGSAGS